MEKAFFTLCLIAALLTLSGCDQEAIEMPANARQIDIELFEAARKNNPKEINRLIESGADIHALNTHNQTPFDYLEAQANNISTSTVAVLTGVSPQEIEYLLPHIDLQANPQNILSNKLIQDFVKQKLFRVESTLYARRLDELELQNMIDANFPSPIPGVKFTSRVEKYRCYYPPYVLKQMVQESLLRVIEDSRSALSADILEKASKMTIETSD